LFKQYRHECRAAGVEPSVRDWVTGTWKGLVIQVTCAIFGHTCVDLDPGDPENGPMPHIVCTRCGRDL